MIAPPILASAEHHHTVENGVIKSLSVSQITAFNEEEEGCEQKWHFNKVLHKKEPERGFNKLGVETHAQLKHTVLTGENVLSRLAMAGVHLIPKKDNNLLLEWGLNDKPQPIDANGKAVNYYPPHESLVWVEGIPLIGFADVIDPQPDHLLSDGSVIHEPGVIEALDYKTTSDFKWKKRASKLPFTTQMNGYGVFVAKKFPWAHSVRLSHLYFLTKGAPKAEKETVVVPIADVLKRWSTAYKPIVDRMKLVAQMKSPEEVKGNLKACENYAGCPHKEYCPTFKNQNAFSKVKTMGLLKNRTAAPAATPAAVVAAPTNGAVATNTPWVTAAPVMGAAPVVAPAAPAAAPARVRPQIADVSVGIPASAAIQGQRYNVGGLEMMFLCTTGGKQSFAPLNGGQPMLLDQNMMVMPATEAAPAMTQVVREPDAPAAPAPLAVQVAAAPAPVVIPAPVAMAPPTMGAAPTATAVPARRRGRPSNAEKAAQAAAAGVPVAAAPQAQPVAPVVVQASAQAAPVVAQAAPAGQTQGLGVRLFVGCVPNGAFTDLGLYVAEAAAEIQAQFGVQDIRSPQDGQSKLAYGMWRGILAASVRADPPPAGDYVAFKGSELVDVAVEALAPMCGENVFRAL